MNIVLTLHQHLDPDSGAPGATLQLAEQYRRVGHDVAVVSFDDLPASLGERPKAILFPWYLVRRLGQLVRRQHIDVVDSSTGDGWIWGSLSSRPRRPLLVTRSHGLEHLAVDALRASDRMGHEHLSWKFPLYHGGLRLWEVARSLRVADVCLFANEPEKDYAIDVLRVPPQRARVVRSGISDEFLQIAEGSRPDYGGPIAIALIGSYVSRKGVTYAASALDRLLRKHEDVSVTFFGTQGQPEVVLRDYDRSLHERIRVIPSYRNDELPLLLRDHQIHLFPTLMEGTGRVLIESMACGLVPVVSGIPGPLGIVTPHRDALVVAPRSPDEICNQIEQLITDRRLLERLGRNARDTAQSYGWSRIAEERLEIYRDCLRARRAREATASR